jgi:quercetin dioxygenase-like cupin family protein
LHIVEGAALVQERDGEVQTLKPGDTIYTAPGVEHWHGASPDSFMVHLAIWEAAAGEEPETVWGEHVTDEEYGK